MMIKNEDRRRKKDWGTIPDRLQSLTSFVILKSQSIVKEVWILILLPVCVRT